MLFFFFFLIPKTCNKLNSNISWALWWLHDHPYYEFNIWETQRSDIFLDWFILVFFILFFFLSFLFFFFFFFLLFLLLSQQWDFNTPSSLRILKEVSFLFLFLFLFFKVHLSVDNTTKRTQPFFNSLNYPSHRKYQYVVYL